MKTFKDQFPALKRYTYLNTAASGLISQELLEFRQDHELDLLISGSNFKKKQDQILAETREAVGSFFHCAPERIALTPNFSYGFNILMEGVDSSKKVLLLENDYPSINWAVQSRDFNVHLVKIDEQVEENILSAVKEHEPDIFAFSLVQYINGIRIGQDFLKRLKKRHPQLLLFADGTQLCGAEELDFADSAVDVLGASAYKWLNAGYGNAFFLFKSNMENKIAPKSLGFNSLQGKHKPHEGSLIGKFEPGHLDTLSFGSLLTAIKLAEEVGMQEIEHRIKKLAAEARANFAAENLLETSVVNRDEHSSIFNIKGDDSLFHKLNAANIVCSQRGEGIRISFHYFNTSEDLAKLMKILRG